MKIFNKLFNKNKEKETEVAKPSLATRLNSGLQKSAQKLSSIFTQAKIDEETLQDFQDILLSCDLGFDASEQIIDIIKKQKFDKNLSVEQLRIILRDAIEQIISPAIKDFVPDYSHKPFVILMVGVNGSGKTTTIGKLAAQLAGEGKKVILAAGDTFRAAASEQLNIWGQRLGIDVVSSTVGSDPASISFEAIKKAQETQADVVFLDTAGRLQNHEELMQELAKIIRVIKKIIPDAPHCVLQTLDGNVGQNAISQVEHFKKIAGVDGIIMTKLDGTARGGILVSIAQKFSLPIYYIGIGEKVEDLTKFSAREYANAICGLKE